MSGPGGGPGAGDPIGGVPDMVRRMRLALPLRWFGDDAPVLDGLLAGWGTAWAGLHAMLALVRRQARLGTATGMMLDTVAGDLFGGRVMRRGMADQEYRERIRAAMARGRMTRAALVAAVLNAGAEDVRVFEPSRPADTGVWGAMGYGVAGGWGSLAMPGQLLLRVTAANPGAVRAAVLDALPAGVTAWMHFD